MASPQLENGYTKIANELIEALTAFRIPGEQMQCFLFIIRKTYGFNKKTDVISVSQFAKGTQLKPSHVCRAINGLLLKKVIIVTKKGNELAKSFGINKDHGQWKSLPKKITLPKKVIAITKKGNESLPKKGNTKDIKETLTKDKYVDTSDEVRLATVLLDYVLEEKALNRRPNIQEWSRQIGLLHRIDRRSFDDIEKVIHWLFKENKENRDFEFVVLSPKALRVKFPNVWVNINRKGKLSFAEQYRKEQGLE